MAGSDLRLYSYVRVCARTDDLADIDLTTSREMTMNISRIAIIGGGPAGTVIAKYVPGTPIESLDIPFPESES